MYNYTYASKYKPQELIPLKRFPKYSRTNLKFLNNIIYRHRRLDSERKVRIVL